MRSGPTPGAGHQGLRLRSQKPDRGIGPQICSHAPGVRQRGAHGLEGWLGRRRPRPRRQGPAEAGAGGRQRRGHAVSLLDGGGARPARAYARPVVRGRVRIISGASGGMLGAACYVTYRKAVAEWDSAERRVPARFDLRLMSSLNDVSGIPTEGKNLIIVAAVNNVLHFRMSTIRVVTLSGNPLETRKLRVLASPGTVRRTITPLLHQSSITPPRLTCD